MESMGALNQMMGGGMAGDGVDAPSRGGQTGQPPGTEEMTPEQVKQIKTVSMLAQAAIADERTGRGLVEQAATGDQGILAVVSGLLKVIKDKLKLQDEMIIPAAVTILIILYKFLVDIGKAEEDPSFIGDLIGKVVAAVGSEYGIDPAQLQEMVAGMKQEMGSGPLGKAAGAAPAEQPAAEEPPAEEQPAAEEPPVDEEEEV